MRGLSAGLLILSALFASGCAREPESGFSRVGASYLGASIDDDDDMQSKPVKPGEVEPAVRHVKSNKVLGAMAFQKVTGRPVDPSRLSGEK